MRLAWFLPSYFLTDHRIYFCMYVWHFDIAFVFFVWPSYIPLYKRMNREYQKDYILKLNKQAIELTQFFVKLFVYLKKRKTILHVHEYRLWVVVVFFFVHVLHNQFGNERRYKQKLDIVIIYECVHCFICTKKTFSTRFVKEYRHSLWWVNVFITLQFLVKSINLLPIIAVNESAHVAKQEPSAFEILALDGIYCRRRIDGGRQRDKKVNLSHVLAGTCRKLIHRRVRVSRCELLT